MTSPVRRSAPRDAGFTMVEVLVAVALFSILGTALATIAVLGMRTSSGLSTRLDNGTQGQGGISSASKVLRTAVLPDQLADQVCVDCTDTAIVSATRSQVSFYANLNNTGGGPSLITLQVVQDHDSARASGMLRITTQPPEVLPDNRYTFCTPSQAGCVTHTRIVTRGLTWPGPEVFAFYDVDGLRITGTGQDATLTEEELAKVSSIDISLVVQTGDGNRVPSSSAVQRVRLPNAEINILVQPSTSASP